MKNDFDKTDRHRKKWNESNVDSLGVKQRTLKTAKDKFIWKGGEFMKLSDYNDHQSLVRPARDYPVIEAGLYYGTIKSARMVERASAYESDGTRVAVSLKVELFDEHSSGPSLWYEPTRSWAKGGKFVQLLQDLEMMPEEGQALNLESFVGIDVLVTIENVQKGNTLFSNITRLQLAEIE
jgi:hypothetical protein